MKTFRIFASLCATALMVAACGGGGGSAGGGTPSLQISSVMNIGSHTNQVATYAAGDLNGDGLEDVVVSGWNVDSTTAYVYVMLQNSDGTLTDKTSQLLANNVIEGSQRILIGDFDADGHVDIFIPGFRDGAQIYGAHSVMFWGTTGQYVRDDWSDVNSAHGACVADMNNDGKPDLLVAGTSYSGAIGGVYINNGNRSFTLNTSVVSGDYWETCSVIKTASNNVIYFGGLSTSAGYRDSLITYDFSMNTVSTVPLQNQSVDTIDSVVADLDGNGQKDFVLSVDTSTTTGERIIVSTTGATVATVETGKYSLYYGRALSNTSVFFAGDTNNASVFNGVTKYKPTTFVDMAGNTQGYQDAFVYQNAQGKLYILELLNGIYKTREM
jgi:FG-GAP-like repeat